MTNFVIDTVEKSRHYGENCRLQGFHIIWQQSDVTLEESHLGPNTIHHRLQEAVVFTKQFQEILTGLIYKYKDCKCFYDVIVVESGPHLYNSLEHVR